MPKLYSAKAVLSTLQRSGFTIVSQKGSHIKLYLQTKDQVFTVIVPNHREIAIGTFQSILKQAGLSKEEFEKLVK